MRPIKLPTLFLLCPEAYYKGPHRNATDTMRLDRWLQECKFKYRVASAVDAEGREKACFMVLGRPGCEELIQEFCDRLGMPCYHALDGTRNVCTLVEKLGPGSKFTADFAWRLEDERPIGTHWRDGQHYFTLGSLGEAL